MTHSYRSTIGENDTRFYFPFSLVKLQLCIQCTLVATCSKYTLSLFLSILLASILFCSILFYSLFCDVRWRWNAQCNAMQCDRSRNNWAMIRNFNKLRYVLHILPYFHSNFISSTVSWLILFMSDKERAIQIVAVVFFLSSLTPKDKTAFVQLIESKRVFE